jgi:8-oxo-dGTP pyrophosphatase MutT (NUDIX family)
MRTTPLPRQLATHAMAYASGTREPVVAQDAATVVLTRDSTAGVEVYLLRRHGDMAFASGMHVFPGGRVDPRDADLDLGWAGPDPDEWGRVLGCEPAVARALVCAAVRETFEESGILLAGPSADSIVTDTGTADWERDRAMLVRHELSMAELATRRRLVVRSDLLNAWAHWITPDFEPRRFDTRFFVTTVPPGQRPRDVSGEADRVAWMPAARACAEVDAGTMQMLPPTYVVCEELAGLGTTTAVMAARPVVRPLQPRLAFVGGSPVLAIGDPDDEPTQ